MIEERPGREASKPAPIYEVGAELSQAIAETEVAQAHAYEPEVAKGKTGLVADASLEAESGRLTHHQTLEVLVGPRRRRPELDQNAQRRQCRRVAHPRLVD